MSYKFCQHDLVCPSLLANGYILELDGTMVILSEIISILLLLLSLIHINLLYNDSTTLNAPCLKILIEV